MGFPFTTPLVCPFRVSWLDGKAWRLFFVYTFPESNDILEGKSASLGTM